MQFIMQLPIHKLGTLCCIREQLQCIHLHLKTHEYIELFTRLSAIKMLLGISNLATREMAGSLLI